jgi:hypothetical protein
MADNVLGTLFGDIANAIRSKTGDTAKMKPSEFPTKILGIEVGGGATVEDIIPEQELTFVYDESNRVHVLSGHNLFNVTSIALGKKYKVVWGSDEYSCTAVEGLYLGQYPMIGIGNPYAIGGEDNNMPFAIGYITIPDDGDSQYSCIIVSLDGSASKRVRVYQDVSGGGSLDGWETIVEERTITASYDTIFLANCTWFPAAALSLEHCGLPVYRVWFDGVAYLCSPYVFHYTYSKEVFGITEADITVLGNPFLQKGGAMTSMTCNYPYDNCTEPFSIVIGNEIDKRINVNDTNPHTLRIDYIPRGRM